jgi:hypothetical protein
MWLMTKLKWSHFKILTNSEQEGENGVFPQPPK